MNTICGLKILIIDDNPIHANRISDLIREAGHEAHIEIDPSKARETIKEHLLQYSPFDVVFLDYIMPKTNGITLSKQLAKIDPFASHIFLTFDHSKETIKKMARHKHTEAYLNKLDPPDNLFDLLNTLVATKKQRYSGGTSFLTQLKEHLKTIPKDI